MRGLTIIAGVILSAAAGTSTAPPDVHKFPECDGPTTDSITIQNFPGNGSYQDIVSMEDKNRCPKQDKPYVGGVSPLDEELSAIFRGPISLKQFAVYKQSIGVVKLDPVQAVRQLRHGHQHFHHRPKNGEKLHKLEERNNGDLVYATIDGQLQSFTMTWGGQPTAAPALPADPNIGLKQGPEKNPLDTAPSTAVPINDGKGDWTRIAYYNAATAEAEGITFLSNNNASEIQTLGYTLDHVQANGRGGPFAPGAGPVEEPVVLEDCLIPDDNEVILSSNAPCQDEDCGATAPAGHKYHGWDGVGKIFLAEFHMPKSGATAGLNPDKPAFWLLNTKIVNTAQYGPCSCWATGCGELDVHEITVSGYDKGCAALHMGNNYAGTPSQGFARPLQGTMKMAVIVTDTLVHIQVLPSGTSFDKALPHDLVEGVMGDSSTPFTPILGPFPSS